jgi:phosphoserine phosphatase
MSPATQTPKIGAFFDIDGTLLPGPSLEWRFASWLEAYGALGIWQIARWSVGTISALLTGEFSEFRRNKTYLAGLPADLIDDWEGSLSPDVLVLFSQGAERVAWHLQQDHRVFLISGTLAPLAEIVARRIGPGIETRATNLELVDGEWTGAIAGNHMSGIEKADAVARVAAR